MPNQPGRDAVTGLFDNPNYEALAGRLLDALLVLSYEERREFSTALELARARVICGEKPSNLARVLGDMKRLHNSVQGCTRTVFGVESRPKDPSGYS